MIKVGYLNQSLFGVTLLVYDYTDQEKTISYKILLL